MQSDQPQKQGASSSIKVLIRVRPLVAAEKDSTEIVQIQPDQKTLKIYNDQINHIQSKFDQVIGKQKTQSEVFSHFQPFTKRIFQGSNLTIFAYGQTGSGKTYTMFGSDWQNFIDKSIANKKQMTYFSEIEEDKNFAGIIPRSINAVFKQYQRLKGSYQLFCSFLQIYNQKIYDLLQVLQLITKDSPTPKALNIHESKINGIFVEGLTQFQVQKFSDCLNLMRQGQKNRFIRETSMNAKSSRSHTIFQVLVEATKSDINGNYTKARLNLCDLAGSEKIHKGEYLQSDHLQELKNINLSLTTLGKVIYALSCGKKTNVAAFRQSKLTRLLQQSLTINTNTFIIVNISPSSKNIDQTINTLKFAERASHVTMKIKPIDFNESNPNSVLKLKQQIQYLKGLLNAKKNGVNQEEFDKQFEKNQKNDKQQQASVTQKQFQKLLLENRKMKKQIFLLQNHLQTGMSERASIHSSRVDSAHSSQNLTESDISTHNSLRKEIYLEKFMKIVQGSPENVKNRRESQNNSILLSAGRATIEHEDVAAQKKGKQQKMNILKKYELMESAKRQSEQTIMEELANIKGFSPGGNKKGSNGNKKQQLPRRYHQANVFRRGKMSLDVSGFDVNAKHVDQGEGVKKKKIDYSQRIKELQNRLYNK